MSTGVSQWVDTALTLMIGSTHGSTVDTAIISAFFRANANGTNPGASVEIVAAPYAPGRLSPDSFKVVSDGWSSDMELWVPEEPSL